jgi:hypothetical protein
MGIDWGRGVCNIDVEKGIRYGVIHSHVLNQDVVSEIYDLVRESFCRNCENIREESCENCCIDEVFGDFSLEGIEGFLHSDGNISVLRSKRTKYCNFCSPCVPGAGDLSSRGEDCEAYDVPEEWYQCD